MKSSKLIELLKALKPDEFRQFYRYLKSPFFTKSAEVLQLYEYLRKFYPQFDTPKLDRQFLFTALYPKEKFNGPRLRNLILKITKILEEYLIYLEYQQNDFQKKKLLTHIYGKRNLNVIFKQKTEELLDDLEQQPYRDAEYFYDTYLLQRDYYFHLNTPKQGVIVKTLKDSLHNLNHFYHIERLRLGIDLKNRERIFSECHDFDRNHTSSITPDKHIIYQVLKKMLCLIDNQEEALFFELKELFIQHIDQISPRDSLIILPFLLNYAIQQIPTQEFPFTADAFDLYKKGIQSGLLLPNGRISDTTFLNTVILGSKVKDFDYINQFIEEKGQLIEKSSRNGLKTLSKSFFYFHQGEYDEVIKSLQSFSFTNILYKLNAKTLLIRTYYQLFEKDSTYYNLLMSNCESFERFLKRELTISFQKKEAYINFTFLLKKTIKQKLSASSIKQEKSELLYLLDNFTQVITRSWLAKIIQRL